MTKLRRLLPVLLLLTACATHSAIERSESYARLGDYENAFEVLDKIREQQIASGGEVDEELADAHAIAYRAYLRDRAQRMIFREREDLALLDLEELARIAPGYPGTAALRASANHKKALRAIETGEGHLLRKEYVEALKAFSEADRIEPGLPEAQDGVAKVKAVTDLMDARARQQFLEAVRKVPQMRFPEVQWHSGIVIHNAPDREDARALRDKAQRENARREVAAGAECEQKRLFGAALLHYRKAWNMDPTLPDVEANVVRMEKAHEASIAVERAQMLFRSDRFDEGRKLLGEAFEKSDLLRGHVSELNMQARQLEGMKRYQEARDLEVLGRKAEALAAFEALSKDWPDGLSDEAARIRGLKVDIDGATSEWELAVAAEAAGDLPKALEHYRASDRYYASLKDAKVQIQRLTEAIAAKQAQEAGGNGGQSPDGEQKPE